MDEGCLEGNCPTQVIMSKIQATATCDSWDKLITSIEGTQILEPKLFHSNTLHSQSLQSLNSYFQIKKPVKKS